MITKFIRLKIRVLKIQKKLKRHKRAFEQEIENVYGIENQNDMMRIHDEKVNKIAECNLPHDIVNTPK